MTENTLYNKSAFFACYLTQRKIIARQGFSNRENNQPSGVDEYDQLELTPLSSITDEDAVEVDKICKFSYSKDLIVIGQEIRNWLIFNGTGLGNTSHKWDFLKAADYLRSRGYLIQWRDLTPDQLISYGWVKVKTI